MSKFGTKKECVSPNKMGDAGHEVVDVAGKVIKM